MPVRDHGHTCIGDADKRRPSSDRAQPRLGCVLVGARAASEPAIVGQVQQETGPDAGGHHGSRKDRLVTDEGRSRRKSANLEVRPPRAGTEAARNGHELLEANHPDEIGENRRQILAERHEMGLVDAGDDAALARDDLNGVVDGRAALAGRSASPARAAPVTRVTCAGRTALMRSSALGSRPSRNGNADSGQIRCVASCRPSVRGPVALSDSVR